jgi:cellulose biosynthesis protein BcsQ
MLKVSFYSYKGGAGRSTTSWNTIHRLVGLMKPTVKEPFVIMDTDTESAGSTFLYEAEDIFSQNNVKPSIQKLIKGDDNWDYSGADDADKKEFFENMHPIGKYFGLPPEQEEAVLLIGVDLDKSSRQDMPSLDKDKKMPDNFGLISLACKNCGVKALFFDTPSGTQDLARLSIQGSDIIVCCMRPTNQFREGTRRQLISFISDKKQKVGKRKYILTPTVICLDDDQTFTFGGSKQVYPQAAKEDIKIAFGTEGMGENDFKQAFKDNVILDMLEPTPDNIKKCFEPESKDNDTVFGIPEVKRFKWFEACLGRLPKEELTSNDKIAVHRYEYLAQTILKYSNEKKD